MEKVVTMLILLAGLIHLLPVPGLFGIDRLANLYGVSITDPNLEIMMRHRAVLFGLVGALLVYGAFRPAYQVLAIIAGLVSAVAFLLIAFSVGGFNELLRKVVVADLVASVALILSAIIRVSIR